MKPFLQNTVFSVLTCAVVLTIAPGLLAQDMFGKPGTPSVAPGEEVTTQVRSSRLTVHPGGNFTLAFVLDLAPGWHVWPSVDQDVLPKEIEDFALRTEVGLEGDTPNWIASIGPTQWPEPRPAPVANPMGGAPIQVKTYQGRAIAFLPMIVAADAAAGQYKLNARVFYQACNESVCLPPETDKSPITITIAPADQTTAAQTPDPDFFSGFDASVFATMHAESIGAGSSTTTSQDADIVDASPGRTFFGVAIPRGDGLLGILTLALLGAIGGFILNLTPCVLPVIPIKILTLSQHAGSRGKTMYLALWMSAGVIAFWVGVGLPIAIFGSVVDPSRIFGIWWLTLGIGVLIAAMGVGIMGLFTIKLPDQVYMINPDVNTARGSFIFGVMTAVLGLPCFGFVAGALLAGAATLPASVVMVIFGSLGVGMASPYFLLAAKPSLLDRIPHTGPASELVKQVMGLLLLAASVYFLGSGLIALVSERPWLVRLIHWWAGASFVSIAGLWLIVRTFQITPKLGPRIAFSLVAIAMAGVTIAYVQSLTTNAREQYTARQAALAKASAQPGQLVTTTWINYSPQLLEQARSEGYTVVLDFTAEWCLNCKALKALVLDRNPVKDSLASDDVISMEVDLTSTKAPGWKQLKDLGQTGIPLLAIYSPGVDTPWQSNAYTPSQVIAALNAARQAEAATAAALTTSPARQ